MAFTSTWDWYLLETDERSKNSLEKSLVELLKIHEPKLFKLLVCNRPIAVFGTEFLFTLTKTSNLEHHEYFQTIVGTFLSLHSTKADQALLKEFREFLQGIANPFGASRDFGRYGLDELAKTLLFLDSKQEEALSSREIRIALNNWTATREALYFGERGHPSMFSTLVIAALRLASPELHIRLTSALTYEELMRKVNKRHRLALSIENS